MKNKLKYYKKFLFNFTNLLAGDASFALIGVFFSIFLARIMDEESLGIYSLAFTVALLIRAFSESGYEMSILRDTNKNYNHSEMIRTTQMFKNFIHTLFLPFALIYSFFVLHQPLLIIILLLWNYPNLFNSTFRTYLRGISEISLQTKIEVFYSLFLYASLAINLYIFKSLTLIFLNFLFVEIIKSIINYKIIKKKFINDLPPLQSLILPHLFTPIRTFKLCWIEFRERYHFGFINILSIYQFRASFMLSSFFLDAKGVGLYSVGNRFIVLLRILPGTVLNLLIPEFSKYESKSWKSIKRKLLVSLILGTFISSIIYFSADFIINLTFKFPESIQVLKLIIWALPILMIHQTLEAFLISNYYEKMVNVSLFLSLISILILGPVLFHFYYLIGIISAYLLGEIILAILYFIFAIKIIKENGRTS